MGWASGGRIVDAVVRAVQHRLPDEERRVLYEALVEALRDEDWDTERDHMGVDPVLDEVLEQ